MELRDLEARRGAQGGVEVRQRLVEEKDLGIAHDRPAERDALALPAGERMRAPVDELGEAEGRGDGSDAAVDLGPVDAAPAQAEGEVLAHAHMRVERVGLEHHGDVAILRRDRVDDALVDGEPARGDRFKPGDHPERRGLAAARRPEQHEELAVGDGERHLVDGEPVAALVALRQAVERDDGHYPLPLAGRGRGGGRGVGRVP